MNALAVAIWVAVIASTLLLGLGLRRSRPRSAGPAPRLHDLSEAAFMAGGPGAVVDTALVSMLGDGRLVAGGPGIVQVCTGARADGIAERAVLEAHRQAPSGWLYQVRYAAMVDPAVQETGDALAARGLLAAPGSGRKWRRRALAQTVVCAAWVVFSLPLTFVALALDPDPQVPFILKVLPALAGGIVMGCVLAARARQRLTPAGRAALREMRARYLNDRTPHVQTALYGLRGLQDPHLREQLAAAARGTRLAAAQARSARRGPSSTSSSTSSSSPVDSCGSSAAILPVVWCASSDGGTGSGAGCGSSSSGCSGGSSCSGASSCSSGSSCSSSSSCSSGSSCSSSSSCGSSSGSSCGSSS
ncbi:TIGR04222 domain-containing membrane protein [Streptomyces sp. NBC_00597]|uniref:TIGR04222 domain-containing membrane protein n=1 Tax=unclassified Streptomyces TaxID=2593676 RepID=UPI002E3493ED|nr:TIGR04222 domain-containing membrane protein [Streptomyces sp. NBC_01278]